MKLFSGEKKIMGGESHYFIFNFCISYYFQVSSYQVIKHYRPSLPWLAHEQRVEMTVLPYHRVDRDLTSMLRCGHPVGPTFHQCYQVNSFFSLGNGVEMFYMSLQNQNKSSSIYQYD